MTSAQEVAAAVRAVIGAALLVVAVAGCPGASAPGGAGASSSDPTMPSPHPATRTALVITGETHGWVEPCGCAEGMLGGIARRVAFVRGLAARGALEPIVIDAGDLAREPGPQTDLKLDALERCMRLLPLGAVALGPRDLPFRARLERALGSRLLAAGAPPRTLETRAGPVRVAVALGSNARAAYESAGLETGATRTASLEAEVVLFLGSLAEARAASLGKPALVVAACGAEDPPPAERLPSGALLVGTTEKAKHALVVALERREGRLTAELAQPPAPLGSRIPDDPEAARAVEEYRRAVFEANLLEAEEKKPLVVGGSYVGPGTCGACHEAAFGVYLKMKHAQSFDALIARHAERDTECLRCHATGAGFASGFTSPSATPDLAHVSCESCHGVGGNHVQAMAGALGAPARPGAPVEGRGDYGRIPEPRKLCVECHDKENSPKFDFDAYWARIKHGK